MTNVTSRRRVTERMEWVVPAPQPWGACWTEVMLAIRMAHNELVTQGKIKNGEEAFDDQIRVLVEDRDGGEIIVSIESEKVTSE